MGLVHATAVRVAPADVRVPGTAKWMREDCAQRFTRWFPLDIESVQKYAREKIRVGINLATLSGFREDLLAAQPKLPDVHLPRQLSDEAKRLEVFGSALASHCGFVRRRQRFLMPW